MADTESGSERQLVIELAEYRSDPVRCERMASETVRVVVQQEDGSTYASIGGRSVFDPTRDL